MAKRTVTLTFLLTAAAVLFGATFAVAQPDPRQMAGIPRPVTDLPDGSVSVRVIRGAMTNNVTKQAVELHVGSQVMTVTTDDNGRAQFDKLMAGAPTKAVAVVDGERLESQEFPAPGQGGIRLLLVASGGGGGAGTAAPEAPAVPAVRGEVTIGPMSRFVMEPGDETLALYYLLELVNRSSAPVNPDTIFTFDLPAEATGAGIMQGSSPLATINGNRVRVQGPFPPGSTVVQVGCTLPVTSGSLDITQKFPVALDEFAVIVKKDGDLKIESPQLAKQQVMEAQGDSYIAGVGTGVAAGQPLSFTLTGLPHRSTVPRWTALGLALGVLILGVWFATRPSSEGDARASERKRLVARREKLFADLLRIENERRQGRGPWADERRYTSRREELLASLEHVYGALDAEGTALDSTSPAGATA